jgi:D-arabinose 1-dehydrogenase-like Zn-dependent alcohol dehydrogenase
MKAAVLNQFAAPLDIEEVARPVPADDEVLIQLEACGVCHSDLSIIDGELPAFRAAAKPRVVPGHEAVGRVVERGKDVTELALGQRVAVFGVGGLGHLAVQIAKAMGAEVIGADVSADKLALATELGAASVMLATDVDALKALAKAGGVHVAIVTSSVNAAFDAAMTVLRPTGTLAVVGLPAKPLSFAALALVGREIRVIGSAVGTRDDLRAVLAMAAAGQLKCRTESQPLEQINQVLERMRGGGIYGRVVLRYGSQD